MTTGTREPAVAAPPTLPGLPLVGSALDLRRRLLPTQERAMRELGDVVRFVAGPPGARLVVHSVFAPEGVQRVLTARSSYRKDNLFYQEVRAVLGDGLLTSQDDDWLAQKRLVQPLFTRRALEGYGPAVTEEAAAMVGRWRAAGDAILDLHAETVRLTLRVICRVLLGAAPEELRRVAGDALPRLGGSVFRRGFAPVRVPRGWPTPANRRDARDLAHLHAALGGLIAARRSRPGGGADMLSLLTREDGGVPDAEVRDLLLVFLFAGHDTTATALTFALQLLGSHPVAQDRAAAEVRDVLGDAPPTAADLPRLPYLGRVLKEALRLYPPAYATSRRLVDADVVCGYRLPAGAEVAVYPWCTHRHPRLWDDPERFEPDRFLPEREALRHRYAWFPFGGGPRACIGAQLATMEATLTLATVLQAHRLETRAGPVPVAPLITLRPTVAVPCRLAPRARP